MISVIVPVYNAGKFVEETIKSILAQTYQSFELLLINDGSKDRSGVICENYEKRDVRIKYFQKDNTGVSDTRNFGILHANGEFIVFVDADDTLPPDALQTYIDAYQDTHADMIAANHSYDYSGKIIPRTGRVRPGLYSYGELRDRLLDDGTLTGILFGSVCGVFYKRDSIISNHVLFQTDVKRNEDGLFNIQLLKYCGKIQVLEESLYYYRQWKSLKQGPLRRDEAFDICDRRIAELLKNRNERSDYETQILRRKVSVAFWNGLHVGSAETTYKESRSYLYKLFSDPDVVRGVQYMDRKNMNVYKKVLCMMIQYKQVTLFYLTIKYLVPWMARFVKR